MSSGSTSESGGLSHYPQVERLLSIMARLRDPENGCPWDKQQSFETIVPFTIEEAYEVADAIEHGSMQDIQDELGDLLFQVVFYAQLGKEQQAFDFEGIAQTICDKLIRRHPHVFAEQKQTSVEQVSLTWDAIKQQERVQKGIHPQASILDNIPIGMSPLMRAQKIQKECAKVGFDWPDVAPVVDKVEEEIAEVMEEVKQDPQDHQRIEEEMGDLLFAVVNLSRHLKVNPETALRKANRKFAGRFAKVEQHFAAQKTELSDATLSQMEAIWQKVKHLEG
ncbi:nucleoside triphosphate pyrophosphohydrolase [Aliiglaciecola sp. 2_MG-2023]|uniref:nucleoside triphosphate pyrophosphohydrolase n=1 Tax=Alteromonadaceae TaxID=72275 RepID=UPI0026E21EDB|nr:MULTISPECIES: nucleoside triphosphate pyrophosphohydrolase [unclassified Aliiglaciecola]MDO6711434.1 nucleoside triphosphate pyrophosphohydrolase [Aliiglaciecola sp. 2_MG-2023]MDO6752589.1 nucleoside triphosphate pyrophosphohydrolase [Aliiglaciecola sp. 1_MG-2023]